MAFLMHIGFDNTHRLSRKCYLFEYRGVRFRLVQNKSREYSDHLLTIIPENDLAARARVFSAASEFGSALGWENGGRIAVWECGGRGCPDNYSLRNAKPNIFTFRRIPFSGNVIGCGINRIPHIQTKSQRIALGLFREANASNNDYLSFLFFWQVLEVDGRDAKGFIDKTFRRNRDRLRINSSDINNLPLGGRSLGQYLSDDCRHSIAHIKRKPGKKELDLDNFDERIRLTLSTRVIKSFAEYYIRQVLNLTDFLYLVRRKRGDFPIFADLQMLRNNRFEKAYPPLRRKNRL